MSKNYKYIILSPDSITIELEHPYYRSKKKAMEAFNRWKERYKVQGYYSSSIRSVGRISLDELENHCRFIRL